MKRALFSILSFVVLSFVALPSLPAEDLNDLAYRYRFLLKAGTILNSEGIGDCLLFPYYDVRKEAGSSQATEINIENTSEYGIAAKLRVRDWAQGKEVFSADIWIPSAGVWRGKIELAENETNAKITSLDSVITDYDASSFYLSQSLTSPPLFSILKKKKSEGPSPSGLYGYIEVIGEEKTAPSEIGSAVGRLAASEQDCPNNMKGTAVIQRPDEGVSMGYEAVAIGNFSRGQGSLFRSPGSPYPLLSNGEDSLDQLEFQLSKWEIMGPYSLDQSIQEKTHLIITFPTKHFHYKNFSKRISQINNPFKAPNMRTGENLTTTTTGENPGQETDSTVDLPFSVNVIGLSDYYSGTPTGIDNSGMSSFYESGEVKLTSDHFAQRIMIQDFEYFEERFSTYRGLPALGLILHEYRNPNLQATITPVEFSAVWEASGLESVYIPAPPNGPTSGSAGVSYTYSVGGSASSLGHPIQYFIDWGDGTNTGWLAVGTTSASKIWTIGGGYTIHAKARCSIHTDIVSAWSDGFPVTIESVSAPSILSGPVKGIPNTVYTYMTGGSFSSVGHPVQYLFDWADGTDTNWLPVGTTTATKFWVKGGEYTLKVRARCATDGSVLSDWTSGLVVKIELIKAPNVPVGPTTGMVGTSYTYMTGGASSNIDDPIQYFFDWGDGTDSGWLSSGTSASKSWAVGGNYSVKVKARCATHTSVESEWSGGLAVTVNNPAPTLASIWPTSGIRLETLDVMFTGTNFISGASSVSFGTGITVNSTTVNSATQIVANITITGAAATGPRNVSVTNASPGGGTATLTNAFMVNNPGPITTSILPTSKAVGDPAFALTVNGTNFVSDSVVRFNGSGRTTTFVSSTQLTAAIPASDLTATGTFQITVFNPAPGGGISNAQTFMVSNPVPTTTSILPTSKAVGDQGFTLTVNGTNFVPNSVVRFNGSDRTTTFVSKTQLTAAIPASDLTATGTFQITVFNPAPGGGISNPQTFTVNNPVPTTTGISPTSKAVGDPAFALTVDGTNFVPNSVVRLGGSDRTTTFVSSTQLSAWILAVDLINPGQVPITVFNPAPGGGISNSQTFTVE